MYRWDDIMNACENIKYKSKIVSCHVTIPALGENFRRRYFEIFFFFFFFFFFFQKTPLTFHANYLQKKKNKKNVIKFSSAEYDHRVVKINEIMRGGLLGGSVGCAVRLETRRSRVQPPPRSATFFRGDWSWNIFYGHSLPSADSRRAVVSFWRKNVHNTG